VSKIVTTTNIHEKLAEAIKRSGKTQTEIARLLNIDQSTVAHYVKGDRLPALDTFANLCKVLDLDANDILCIDD